MDIHHQIPDEVVLTEPLTATSSEVESAFDSPDPTRFTYSRYRLGTAPIKTEEEQSLTETQRLETEDKGEAKALWEDFNTLYHVSPSEREAAEAAWREWVTKRNSVNGALDPGRFYTPSKKPLWQPELPFHVGAEERSRRAFEVQHRFCLTCSAIAVVKGDVSLSEEEKRERIAGMAHTIPRLQPLVSTTVPARTSDVMTPSDLENVSAWGHEQASSSRSKSLALPVYNFRNAIPKVDVLELRSRFFTEFSDRREYFHATSYILQDADDKVMSEDMMLDPKFLLRYHTFRQNERAVEKAICITGYLQSLGTVEKRTLAKKVAEAWELERDLVRLESLRETLAIRIDWANKGYSVNRYNSAKVKDRSGDYAGTRSHSIRAGGLGRHKRAPIDDGDAENKKEKSKENFIAVENLIDRMIQSSQQQAQNSPELPAHAEPAELNVNPASPPSPHTLTESPGEQIRGEMPAQSTSGPGLFLNILHNFHQHTLEAAQEDNGSPLTEGDPVKHDVTPEDVPAVEDAAAATVPANELPASSTTKGKAKKDSKVEDLMEDEGVSLKDLTAKSDEKKLKGVRKGSAKPGPSRPVWR